MFFSAPPMLNSFTFLGLNSNVIHLRVYLHCTFNFLVENNNLSFQCCLLNVYRYNRKSTKPADNALMINWNLLQLKGSSVIWRMKMKLTETVGLILNQVQLFKNQINFWIIEYFSKLWHIWHKWLCLICFCSRSNCTNITIGCKSYLKLCEAQCSSHVNIVR